MRSGLPKAVAVQQVVRMHPILYAGLPGYFIGKRFIFLRVHTGMVAANNRAAAGGIAADDLPRLSPLIKNGDSK